MGDGWCRKLVRENWGEGKGKGEGEGVECSTLWKQTLFDFIRVAPSTPMGKIPYSTRLPCRQRELSKLR